MDTEREDYLGRVVETLMGEQAGQVVSDIGTQTSVQMDSPLGIMIGAGFVLYAVAAILKTPTVKVVTETATDIVRDNHASAKARRVEDLNKAERRAALMRELERLDQEE